MTPRPGDIVWHRGSRGRVRRVTKRTVTVDTEYYQGSGAFGGAGSSQVVWPLGDIEPNTPEHEAAFAARRAHRKLASALHEVTADDVGHWTEEQRAQAWALLEALP